MKHTPGPWKHSTHDGWDIVTSQQDGTICKLVYNNPENSRLIAAAPDLLEALKGLNYYGEDGNGFCCCPRMNWQDPDELHSTACADARKAISKAEKGA